ncbi:unnamed protein product [Brachionus calyciflorus]|uniref:Reverse transcriptase domain-containing protein n=1 Tax=Brachionus calyciflorus TaxID=104777 RepID=A0A814F558_9BILA|nr:unnamed protein product [Brachionus calyciflorus]
MQLESSRNHTSVYGENRNLNVDIRSIKVPEVFKEGMDLKSCFILMEIYLKNFPNRFPITVNWIKQSIESHTSVTSNFCFKTYSLIKRHASESYLEEYRGGKLYLASGEIYIYGFLRLNRCLIAHVILLSNTNVIVTNNCSGHQCLLSRDIINRIPVLKQRIDSIKSVFHEYSTVVLKIFREEMKEKTQQPDLTKQKKNYFLKKQFLKIVLNLKLVKNSRIEIKKEIKNEWPNSCESKSQVNNQDIKPEINSNLTHCDDDSKQNNFVNIVQQEQPSFVEAEEFILKKFKETSVDSVMDLKPSENQYEKFKIEFKNENHKPTKCKCRPLPYNLKEKVRLEIEKLLRAGTIRPSKSEWCSPIRVGDKTDGTIRITVDYKELNKVIKDYNYPLPSISDMFNKLTNSDTFTKADLISAFHQIPVHEDFMEVTAFICQFGVYEYVCMPFGI